MKRLFIKSFFEENIRESIGQEIIIKGWVRSKRESKSVTFLAVNDGTIVHSIQAVVDNAAVSEEIMKQVTTGACVEVHGTIVESPAQGQFVEIHVSQVIVIGTCPVDTYPLQKKGHTLEFLREIAHLRPRTNTFGAVLRIRHNLSFAIHQFFHEKGFFYLHSPIITGSDAEGAGAMFRVSVLDPKNPPLNEDGSVN